MLSVIRIVGGILLILGGLGNLVSTIGMREDVRSFYYIISVAFFMLGAALIIVGVTSRRKKSSGEGGS